MCAPTLLEQSEVEKEDGQRRGEQRRKPIRHELHSRAGVELLERGYDAAMLGPRTLPRSLGGRAKAAGKSAGVGALSAGEALVEAVEKVVDHAINRMLLGDKRVTSAAQGKSLLAGETDAEAFAGDIQRVVVIAVPVVRRLARGARLTRVPWVMVASSAISVGIAVSTGVRELRTLASLVAHRLEQATGERSDPALVKKLAIDLYLHPKGTLRLDDDRLRLVRLTRKWVSSGMFGRKTSKRAERALDAAERLDGAALSERWAELQRKPAGTE
jgi:hypothetical protein